jgi:hypothetical protein
MARRYIRDKNGRFASTGGGGVRAIKNTGRTVTGGGEATRGSTRASRNMRLKNEENLRVSQHKAHSPYEKAVGRSSYAHKKARKLEKSGADPATVAQAKKTAEAKESATRLARQRFLSLSTVSKRRYRVNTGLVQQRRYARPR